MSLRDRIVAAAIDALSESDPLLMISVGECEIRVGWKPKTVAAFEAKQADDE